MHATNRFHEVLFELSNEDRYRILLELESVDNNVTSVANLLQMTTQEASRHLSRLSDAGLIEKTSRGEYCLTEYGRLVLSQVKGLMFATSNSGYFQQHSVPSIPSMFLSRLPDIADSRNVDDIMVVFALIERMIDEAEEYIWRLTDRYNMMSLPKLETATDKGVQFRLMQTKHFQYPPDWPGPGIVLRDARLEGLFDVRTSKEANLFIAMNEKEVAILGFPVGENSFDYRGFTSTDPLFHSWCHDVFEYYWEDAIPVV